MGSPRVSVVMPVYNCEKYIAKAIESILTQSFADYELLIIDDCSTDGTVEIIKKYNDNRIKLIKNEKNSGVALTRNIGYRRASGEYIVIADSDDINHPDRLLKKVNFLDENPNIDVVSCWYQEFYSDNKIGKTVKFDQKDIDIRANWIFHAGIPSFMMFRKQKIKDNRLLFHDEKFKAAVDYQWYTSLTEDIHLYCISEVLYFYRRHESQISTNGFSKQQRFADLIRLQQLKDLGLEPTKEQFEFHQYLCGNVMQELSNDIFGNIIRWCEQLMVANNVKKIFDTHSFNLVIANKLVSTLNNEPLYSIERDQMFSKTSFSLYIKDKSFDNRKLKNIMGKSKPVVIFGTKRLGYKIKKYLEDNDIKITNFIDNNEVNHGKKIEECYIIPSAKIKNIKDTSVIISIISNARFEVKKQLIEIYGAREENIYLLEDLGY